MDILSLHFIRPGWLLMLPVAVLIPLLWRRLRRASGDWSRVCDAHLLRWLSVGGGAGRSHQAGAWLAGLMWFLAAVALAGPSWEKLPDSSFTARDARVLVLDLSRSMLAEDLKPNRLIQARYRLSDLLNATQEGQVGLVAFAGDAFVVSPLTSDTNTISNMLPALRPDVIPVAGSRPDRALELAAQLLQRSGNAGGEILLIADSGNRVAAEVAARFKRHGIYTSVLAVGTRQGAPVPSGDGFVSDAQGRVVIARLQRDALRAIADAGAGKYSELRTGSVSKSPWVAASSREFIRRDDAPGERWNDSGPWLLLLLLPLVAFSFRRGLLFMLPLLALPGMLLSMDARASLWDDLWINRDQQAQRALTQNRAADAAALARDPQLAGEALYRAGEYPQASKAWSEINNADASYNAGNALARAGQLDAAIAAYDKALELQPGMPDATFNRDLVEQLKQQQEQQKQDQKKQDQEKQDQKNGQGDDSRDSAGQQGEDSKDQAREQSKQGDQDADQQPQSKRSGEDSKQQAEAQKDSKKAAADMAQNWSEEDAQAMEQWLRRIPDDPGGLLRRKFRYEYQRRGAAVKESETW